MSKPILRVIVPKKGGTISDLLKEKLPKGIEARLFLGITNNTKKSKVVDLFYDKKKGFSLQVK